MFLTHTNSIYSEEITLIDHVPYPQYGHQISDGGLPVRKGIKTMPAALVHYVLSGQHGAMDGTSKFIRALTSTNKHKVGFILASGGTTWTGYEASTVRTDRYPVHQVVPMGLTQVYAGSIANKIGDFDYIVTDSSSCISGHSAWYTASMLMQVGRLDAVVIISVDNGLSEEYMDVFSSHKLSKALDEEYDSSVQKFRLGQGCNISVFESENCATDTNHAPIAKIIDMHIAAESYSSPLGISPEGSGYCKVINNVNTSNISFIKTHSTFSCDNAIEAELINSRFGDIRTINYKLRIGHTMGASTAIETALAITEESGTFLSLGAGMGNAYSSAVVEIC
jgi:3-oxoacyl-(acyl-carrier-protein) synthase|tara:strand:+ start:398 stop:1408 length:1011 start_codon:yes stop_codon:yes gene_type:complete